MLCIMSSHCKWMLCIMSSHCKWMLCSMSSHCNWMLIKLSVQPTISLEMPVPCYGHYGFHSFPVVDWFCLFKYLWVLTFPLEDCSEFGNFVITLIWIFFCFHLETQKRVDWNWLPFWILHLRDYSINIMYRINTHLLSHSHCLLAAPRKRSPIYINRT
jgi:hypothetical protein